MPTARGDTLLPDRLRELWRGVERQQLTEEDFVREQERLLGEHRRIWTDALLLPRRQELARSLLAELGQYVDCSDLTEVRRRCRDAMSGVEHEWEKHVRSPDRQSIEQFYDQSPVHLYELTWWHSLVDDASPLAYVTALQFAQQHGCRDVLDFGAGVGSGGILFSRHALKVALADISTTMLDFCEWRFGYVRQLPVQIIDLKFTELPANAFDLVTAMDVFEHLVDPVATVEQVWASLRPGGFLFGRFDDSPHQEGETDGDSHEHIVQDFGPMFERMASLGFTKVWQDEWLWGHLAFQRR